MSPAVTAAPILDVLAERWSTRIFDAETPIDEAALASALEAARWAPSANNTQPWRFVVARRGTAEHAAHFTVQAHASGLYTHQMGGFDRDQIAQAFGFGDDLAAVTVMAVGALGDIATAPERLRERELAPRTRRPIGESLVVDA